MFDPAEPTGCVRKKGGGLWWRRGWRAGACRYPGVRHRVVRDAEEAAEFCVFLTRALTKQPYEPQVIPPSPRGHTHTPHRPHDAHTRTGDFRRSASITVITEPLMCPQQVLYKACSTKASGYSLAATVVWKVPHAASSLLAH